MATSKKFSELPVASSMNNGDLFAVAQEDAQAETGYTSKSATALVVGKKLNGEIEYATDLPSFPPGDQNPFDALEYLNSKINDLYPVNSASGSIANFTTSLALPLVNLKAYIQAQGGGGTPSAPVAITGFDSVVITQADENMQTVNTFTIQLGQTVYGGYIDKNTGKLVVTHKMLDLTNLGTWNSGSANENGYIRFNKRILDKKMGLSNVITSDIFQYSDTFVTNSVSSPIISGNGENIIYFGFPASLLTGDLSTSEGRSTALYDWIANNSFQIVYELATPIETDITLPDITALVGENNIFADSGDIELSYKMGVQEYIDKKIAETQALIL